MTWQEFFTEVWHAEIFSWTTFQMLLVFAVVGVFFK